jgi:hypothetical protein
MMLGDLLAVLFYFAAITLIGLCWPILMETKQCPTPEVPKATCIQLLK